MQTQFFNHLNNLHYLAPRFWDNEKKAASYIKSILLASNINFVSQSYEVTYPYWKEYYLKADNLFLEVLPCGFSSGYFKNKYKIVDSSSLEPVYDECVISYNSKCKFLSTPVMYPHVALAIKPDDVSILKNAKNIEVYLQTIPYSFVGENILVWNLSNPKKILICHYDSFWGGSLDNGTGTALLLTLASYLDLSKYLLVFAWSEEISLAEYERYWCYGYRQFEKTYLSVMEKTEEIIIFDSFGYKTNTIITDLEILKEAFLIDNSTLLSKVKMYASKFEDILENYHTLADTPNKITSVDFDEILALIKQ